MDNRAYAAGYAWSRDHDGAPERVWEFRSEKVTLPTGAVREIRHHGYSCLLALWADVQAAIPSPVVAPEHIAPTVKSEKDESARIFPEQVAAMKAALATQSEPANG